MIGFYDSKENKEVIKIINLCVRLGREELYAQMSENNSIYTAETLEEILELTNFENEFYFEKIAKKYSFSEEKGWGKTFDYKTFKRK